MRVSAAGELFTQEKLNEMLQNKTDPVTYVWMYESMLLYPRNCACRNSCVNSLLVLLYALLIHRLAQEPQLFYYSLALRIDWQRHFSL